MRSRLLRVSVVVAAGAVALGALRFGVTSARSTSATSSCAGVCLANVAAAALWSVWNQVDCDDEDTYIGAAPTCADDAQNVNRAASVRDFVNGSQFSAVTVDIEIGNVLTSYRVRVDRSTWQAMSPVLQP